MIRLRTKTGKRLKVSEDVPFIEICDEDGNLGAVVMQFPKGEIKVVTPGDDSFIRYVKTFKSKITNYAEVVNQKMKEVEEHDKRKRELL